MTLPSIKVEGLSKEYHVEDSAHPSHATLYELIGHSLRAPWRPSAKTRPLPAGPERFYALRDVGFEVQPGEVMGVIGKNGAGKSTLLKILSRITAPTEGRVEVRGRLASLLEVGTGFHPELSGRENIFLNGAILGMTRREVAQKYDEIVAFAEVEKFIDTPVKRYSSGMYVRLAFAVAAHLEPDVLVIDEVLAVGDAAFQRKCLGKINDVATGGRTVLFVSHNMQAVQSLCTRCLLISHGRVAASGPPATVIRKYLESTSSESTMAWRDDPGLGTRGVRLVRFAVGTQDGGAADTALPSNEDIVVDMQVWLERPSTALCVGFDLLSNEGATILRSYQTDLRPESIPSMQAGTNLLRCTIPRGLLNAGRYRLAPRIGIHNQEWIVNSDPLISFSIFLNHGESPFWNSLDDSSRPGPLAPVFRWSSQNSVRSDADRTTSSIA
jgi:lipopolysaccharide transport system ATP-binding protein